MADCRKWPSFVQIAWDGDIGTRYKHTHTIHSWDAYSHNGEIYLSSIDGKESITLISKHGRWFEKVEREVHFAYPIGGHARAISIFGHDLDHSKPHSQNSSLLDIKCPDCLGEQGEFSSAFCEFRNGRASSSPDQWLSNFISGNAPVDVLVCQSCGCVSELLCTFGDGGNYMWIQATDLNLVELDKVVSACLDTFPSVLARLVLEFLHPFKGNVREGESETVSMVDNLSLLENGNRHTIRTGDQDISCDCGGVYGGESIESRLDSNNCIRCAFGGELMEMLGRFALDRCGDVYLFYSPCANERGVVTAIELVYCFESAWYCRGDGYY